MISLIIICMNCFRETSVDNYGPTREGDAGFKFKGYQNLLNELLL